MFITKDELRSVVYQYQVDQITDADDDIVYMAITAAEDEVKSYLKPNNKKGYKDGRPLYDVATIFSKTGAQRSALLMEWTKSVSLYYLVRLCNADILYEHAKDRYDRAVASLVKVNAGDMTLDLALLDPESITDTVSTKQPFRFGSRTKFNHE